MRRVHNSDDAINSLSKLANIIELIAHFNKSYDPELRVKCWAKLGEWKFAQSPPGKSLMGTEMHEILGAFKRCTVYDRHGYRSWHNWAMVNFRLAQQYDDTKENVLYAYKLSHKSKLPSNFSAVLQNHIKTAIHAFIKAIALGTKRWSALVQQDLLNFLSCLFRYGESKDVASVIKEEIGTVPLDAWMGVLPQLLARFQIKSPTVREILHRLLEQVGQKHPQALLYPLAVMVQSPADERKVAADTLLDSLKRHSPDLVQHVLMVSSELVNVAILAIEEWFEALEDASKFAFVDNDFPHMIETLVPLHKTMETGPLNETDRQFFNGHGKNLAKAYSYLKEYIKLSSKADIENNKYAPFHPSDPGRRNDTAADAARNLAAMKDAAMNNAWDIYYTAFRKINGQLPTIASIPLEQCSTALFRARDLEIAVPGSYRVDGSYVKIKKFHSNVQILPSKQRPRKMIIQGVDGKDYMIVLKGHEDLRQDERVMQLFGSINALMARDRRTNNHDLNIQRYNITPLAFKAGKKIYQIGCKYFGVQSDT
jgi:FKBP12-rapamycin complex-associated protein